jgi:sugar phosphate isomerase/epimerase
MQLGMMNDPRLNACTEARWAAAHGFEFLDLTIEGPGAALEQIDVTELQAILASAGMGIVGHTAWYLPFASPLARLRQAAVECVADAFDLFARLGARTVNVHIPAGRQMVHLFKRDDSMRWVAECFAQLAERAAPYNLQIMAEHPPDPGVGISDITSILAVDKRLGLHLDVGHANVGGDKLEGLLDRLGSRLVHVHLSDNRGNNDDHMPLGAGRVDWPRAIRLLKQHGYDGTITLEVFSQDRDYLLLSAQKVRAWWRDVE